MTIITMREKILAALAAGLFLGVFGAYTLMSGRSGVASEQRRVSALVPERAAPSLRDVAAEVKKGGYILYFRHAQREKWDSVIAFDVYEIATVLIPRGPVLITPYVSPRKDARKPK